MWGEEGAVDAHTCCLGVLPVGMHDSPGAAKIAPPKKWTPGCRVDSLEGARDADLPPAWGSYSPRSTAPLPPLIPTATVPGFLSQLLTKRLTTWSRNSDAEGAPTSHSESGPRSFPEMHRLFFPNHGAAHLCQFQIFCFLGHHGSIAKILQRSHN